MLILANKYDVVGIKDSTEMEEHMKKITKRVIGVLLVVVLLVGVLPTPCQTVQAATPYMKKLDVKWDLKNGKSVVCKTVFAGGVKGEISLKISGLKVTKANKKGYKKCTFTYTSKYKTKLTALQVRKILKSKYFKKYSNVSGSAFYAIVDYDTGASLEYNYGSLHERPLIDNLDVTVLESKEKTTNKKKYRDKKTKGWVSLGTYTCKVSVVYPENYTGLCIGIGGYNIVSETYADSEFWDAMKPFGKTSYYKKGKKNSHWLRVE